VAFASTSWGPPASRSLQPFRAVGFPVPYVLTLTDEVLDHVRSNMGIGYAYYDGGAYRNELEKGDMRRAPEALRLVNSGLRQARNEARDGGEDESRAEGIPPVGLEDEAEEIGSPEVQEVGLGRH